MSVFVKATPAPTPKTDRVKVISLFYAGILVVLALTQLYTFDKFIELIPEFNLPLSETLTFLAAPLLVVCEVFALPFLLRMRLSPAFRFLSMIFGWLVAVIWFFISLWLVTTYQAVATVGFLGTLGDLTPGWWAVFFSIALGILAAWSSWGMWPLTKQPKTVAPKAKK